LFSHTQFAEVLRVGENSSGLGRHTKSQVNGWRLAGLGLWIPFRDSLLLSFFLEAARLLSSFYEKTPFFTLLGKKCGGVGERYEYVLFFSTRSTISRIQTLHNQKWNSRSLWMRKKNKKRRTRMSVSINFGEKKGKQ